MTSENIETFIAPLLYDYLTKKDANLAEIFKKKMQAVSRIFLSSYSLELINMEQCIIRFSVLGYPFMNGTLITHVLLLCRHFKNTCRISVDVMSF